MKKNALFVMFFLFFYNTETIGLDKMKLRESVDGKIIVEQIGKSVYVRFHDIRSFGGGGETRRYMDITPLMNYDEFIRISNRIATIGQSIIVQKPHTDVWKLDNFSLSQELSPYWDPFPRYDIKIENVFNDYDYFLFICHPKGYVGIKNYRLDVWNFGVPNYVEKHIYVMIQYSNDFKDLITDEKLFEISRIQIERLKKL
ncbi:hypothetical protein R80B4_02822 [Fibrobacteres bacterium R8-0-B4]